MCHKKNAFSQSKTARNTLCRNKETPKHSVLSAIQRFVCLKRCILHLVLCIILHEIPSDSYSTSQRKNKTLFLQMAAEHISLNISDCVDWFSIYSSTLRQKLIFAWKRYRPRRELTMLVACCIGLLTKNVSCIYILIN